MNKKVIASFELTLMIVSLFAFSYMIGLSDEVFAGVTRESKKIEVEMLVKSGNVSPRKTLVGAIIDVIFDKLRRPMIPVVSANDKGFGDWLDEFSGKDLITAEIGSSYPVASNAGYSGCCLIADDGAKCGAASPNECVGDSPFVEGATCSHTSFCKRGCCYDESAGVYDSNTLKMDCPSSWNDDPNCNIPQATLGCCVVGSNSFFTTNGQCEVRTLALAQGDGVVDWRGNLNAGECMILSATQNEGACILEGGDCDFVTEEACYGYNGDFREGFLCTSPHVESNCEMTEQTTCEEGKDGVYFMDSCGNIANIYDSNRKDDPTYWDTIIAPEEICGNDDEDGNGDSASCGNCNRFFGGICDSADDNNFDVDVGEFYCRDTSCMVDGESYKNGESWCVYDGAIGEGQDVVGSRHWKYVCSQGTTQIEPCADYRNQICVQQNTFEIDGEDVTFRNANCVANNWRKCIDLNGKENGTMECAETLNCRVDTIDVANKFRFDVCLPKYPGGFSLKNPRYQETTEGICAMADQTCTVVYKPKTFGGCKLVANGNCLTEIFAQEMNDFCTGLGDCGGTVNVEGVYSENYNVRKSPKLSASWINDLKNLANPVSGQYAEVEDYSEYLEAAGVWSEPSAAPKGSETEGINTDIAIGLTGIGYAAGVLVTGSLGLSGLTSVVGIIQGAGLAGTGAGGLAVGLAGFSGAAIGAGIGFVAGSMIAEQMGLSPAGSMLMAVGAGLVGVAFVIGNIWNPVGQIGAILIIVSLFFGGSKCKPIEVEFECKPYKAPSGATDCEKCNEDPLKPCSEYRCNSLGGACELVNKGTEQEMCHSTKDDGRPPILNPQLNMISDSEQYNSITDDGFEITNREGGCVDAYTALLFGITTNELSYCRFDVEAKDFEEMDHDFGSHAYIYNHTTTFSLPDPSHGQSQGIDWSGDLTLFVKCEDAYGHVLPDFYKINVCVNEGPDVSGPVIGGATGSDGSSDGSDGTGTNSPGQAYFDNDILVGFDVTSKDINIITNELSTCGWALEDIDYSAMVNIMDCNDDFGNPSGPLGYLCTDTVPVDGKENKYYIKCADQPWLDDFGDRNVGDFIYMIRKPEHKISIESIEPNADIEIATAATPVELKVVTANGGEEHACSFSFSGYDSMIPMDDTGEGTVHTQPFNRPVGPDEIYVECTDETEDFAQDFTEYEIIRDTSTPVVARVWQDSGRIHVVTTEAAECKYSTKTCRFNWKDGLDAGKAEEHRITVVKGNTYYIKCEDEFGNAPSGCSVTLQAL